MKDFLESYRYSSYQDYLGIDRAEKNILDAKSFPEYFEQLNSFKDFLKEYLITTS